VKKLLLVTFLFLAFLSLRGSSDALVIQTPIGNPPELNSEIIHWGRVLADTIQPYEQLCGWGYKMYNKLTIRLSSNGYTTPYRTGSCGFSGNTFFCTNIVKSSYALAGHQNSWSQSVFHMARNWQTKGPGYAVLTENNRSSVSQIKPGDVFFMGSEPDSLDTFSSGHRHVILVEDVNIDPTTGWGRINYVQSNGPKTRSHLRVENWVVKHNYSSNPNGAWWIGLGPR